MFKIKTFKLRSRKKSSYELNSTLGNIKRDIVFNGTSFSKDEEYTRYFKQIYFKSGHRIERKKRKKYWIVLLQTRSLNTRMRTLLIYEVKITWSEEKERTPDRKFVQRFFDFDVYAEYWFKVNEKTLPKGTEWSLSSTWQKRGNMIVRKLILGLIFWPCPYIKVVKCHCTWYLLIVQL